MVSKYLFSTLFFAGLMVIICLLGNPLIPYTPIPMHIIPEIIGAFCFGAWMAEINRSILDVIMIWFFASIGNAFIIVLVVNETKVTILNLLTATLVSFILAYPFLIGYTYLQWVRSK